MNKFIFNDYFHEPQGKIAKRMLFKSDNVIAFVLNIAKGEILPGHTHLESTFFLQVMEGNAKAITDGNETSLQVGELMQVDGKESMQVYKHRRRCLTPLRHNFTNGFRGLCNRCKCLMTFFTIYTTI